MKKTKLKHRIENAVNAFFDDRENYDENGLIFVADSRLQKRETTARAKEKGDVLVKILKRAFIFLPGALYLFFGTLTIFSFDFLWNPALAVLVFLIGSFMTIFGIGNLKNLKYLAIPLSICAISLAAYAIFSTFGGLKSVFEYGIYFFPLALISSFLVKSLIDKTGSVEN